MESNGKQNWEIIKLCIRNCRKNQDNRSEKTILSDLKELDFTNDLCINSDIVRDNEEKNSVFYKLLKYFEVKGKFFLFISVLKNEESIEEIVDIIKEKCISFQKEKFLEDLNTYLKAISLGEESAKKFLKNDDFPDAFFNSNNYKNTATYENLNINFTNRDQSLKCSEIFDKKIERSKINTNKLQKVLVYDNGYQAIVIDKIFDHINYSFSSDSSCQLIIKRLIENEVHTAFIDITASNVINVELKVNDVPIDRRKILNLFLKEKIILLEKQSLHEIFKKFLEEEKQYAVDYNYFLDECLPIKTLENLANWKPPPTKHVTAPLSKRKKDLNLIKTLVCHDMKGGYLEDRFINGAKQDDPFFFVHWAAVDVFGYFSHNLVSIPPCSWISAAHRNGVQVIGTFISEWDEGVKVFETAFSNKILVDQLCMQLVNIATHYNFDGWLINIENEVKPCQIVLLNHFVKSLTSKMHAYIPGSQVIWYDSVLKNGDLEWQNCLNESNRAFFLNADGIFLDYKWKEKQLIYSYLQAAGRNVDVYVGIDVFGRGDCFTKGGFMTDICLKEIRKHDLSAGIFAPGWVYECLELKEFKENQFKFWGILQELIPPRIIEGLPYCSSFCPGFGNKMYRNGKIVSYDAWINLNLQQPQPIYYPTAVNCISLYTDDAFNGGGCLCLSGDVIDDKTTLEFNILKTSFCLESSCVISYTFKPLTQNTDIALHLDISSDQGAYKIRLVSTDCKNKEDTNTSVKYLLPATMDDILKAGYKMSPSSEQQTWIKRTYVLNSIDFRNHTIQNISVILSDKTLSAKPFTVLFGELEILPVYPVHNLTCEKLICKKSSVKSKTVDIECTLKWQYNSSVFCSDIYIQSAKEAKQYVCTTNQFYYNLKCSVNLTDEIEVILRPKSAGSENLETSLIKIPIKL